MGRRPTASSPRTTSPRTRCPRTRSPLDEVPPDKVPRGLFTAALRVREFRALWIADTLSVLGTQVSRVCLALIVFDRTGSATATALIYALTFLPTLVGGRCCRASPTACPGGPS